MTIFTQRLRLRKLREDDIPALFAAMDCPQVHDMYSYGFTSAEKVKSYVDLIISEYAAGKNRTLAVADRESDELIGSVNLDIEDGCGGFSYWIVRERRNRGYGTETIRAIIDYFFNTAGLSRVEAFTSNPVSERVMQRCGMRLIEVKKNFFTSGGVVRDAKVYEIRK